MELGTAPASDISGTSYDRKGNIGMTDGEPLAPTINRVTTADSLNAPSWRYLGDRNAADVAYCERFGVDEPPEPTEAWNGVWSYALPTRAR